MDSRFSRIKSSADLASLDQPSLKEYMRQLFTAYGYTVTVPDEKQFGDVLLLRLKHGSGAFDLTVTLVVCDGTQSSSKWFEQHVLDAMKLYKSDYLWLVGPHADHVKLSHKTMRLNIQVISRKVMDDRIAYARMPDATAGVASQTRNLGRWGTCPLTLRSDGALTIGAGRVGHEELTEVLGDWASSVREVRLSGRVVAPSFGYRAFAGLAFVVRMDLSRLDTSSVTDMSWMFDGCESLATLDTSRWDTSSVTDMKWMFKGCESLAKLDVSGWDTSSVTSMSGVFSRCGSLSSIDVSRWDTSSVNSMSCMFTGCKSLSSIDVSKWDTSSVTDMSFMFSGCDKLESLDTSGWDTSSVTDMECVFRDEDKLPDPPTTRLGRWGTCPLTLRSDGTLTIGSGSAGHEELAELLGNQASLVREVRLLGRVVAPSFTFRAFAGLASVERMDLRGLDTSSVTSMSWMFEDCVSLSSLDVSGWDTSSVTSMAGMFNGCESLAAFDVSRWDTSSVNSMSCMFTGCKSLSSIDVSKWDTSSVTDMSLMFSGCDKLESLYTSGWDTSSVTDMAYMFFECNKLDSLDVSGWDTSAVTSMRCVFRGKDKLPDSPTRNLGRWGTCTLSLRPDGTLAIGQGHAGREKLAEVLGGRSDSVREVRLSGRVVAPSSCYGAFAGLASVERMDLRGLDTSSVTSMSWMFEDCVSLSSLDASGWDTSSVTSMAGMFSGCESLATLDVSRWDTSSVTDMAFMFFGCDKLDSLDVSGWDTSSVTDMECVFRDEDKLPDPPTRNLGRWGTCTLSLRPDGTLAIGQGHAGREKLAEVLGNQASLVREVRLLGRVVAPSSCYRVFAGLASVERMDLRGLDTSSTLSMFCMFADCPKLAVLDASGWDTSSVQSMFCMFDGCESLATLDAFGWDTSSVTDMSWMFDGCSSLESLDTSGWDTSSVTSMQREYEYHGLLSQVTALLQELPAAPRAKGQSRSRQRVKPNGRKVKPNGLRDEPMRPKASSEGSYGRWGTCHLSLDGEGVLTIGKGRTGQARLADLLGDLADGVSEVYLTGRVRVSESCRKMFAGLGSVAVMDLRQLDTSVALDMSAMFQGCALLEEVDASGWDTNGVFDLSHMFDGCASLVELDTACWDTASATDMHAMFRGCASLGALDVCGWDMSHVADASYMFDGCASLVDLDFLTWRMPPLCDVDGMFCECVSLTSLDSLRWEAEAVPRPPEPRAPVGLVPRSRLKLARRGRRAWPEMLAEGELF